MCLFGFRLVRVRFWFRSAIFIRRTADLPKHIQSANDGGHHGKANPVPEVAQTAVVRQPQDVGNMFGALDHRHQQDGDYPSQGINGIDRFQRAEFAINPSFTA